MSENKEQDILIKELCESNSLYVETSTDAKNGQIDHLAPV
jgi:hypothetical protein